MNRADFDAAAAEISDATAGEWEARAMSVIAGRIATVGLFYKGSEIIQAASIGKDREWLMRVANTIYRACMSFAIAELVAA